MVPPFEPLGLTRLDALESVVDPTLSQYVDAVSEYVLRASSLDGSQKKAAQIRLSNVLGRCLAAALERCELPVTDLHVGERQVSGALRPVNADVSQADALDGLRLAVEIKPVNLAVGRAIWNRFGDIRTFAVNLHLKFPFAVVGGLLVVPTVEIQAGEQRSTLHLIERLVTRLARAGGRLTEGDAPHLLEGVGVIVYDPNTATLSPVLPPAGSGLRWEEFVANLANAYAARFE